MKIEQLIRNRRLSLGLTLKQVADALGVAESTVSRYESNEIRNMGIDKIEALAAVLKVSPSYLMGWTEDTAPTPQRKLKPATKKRYPLLGSVACGAPTLADDHLEALIETETDFDCDFVVRADGSSMIEAGIKPGDIVFIKKQSYVNNGQVACVAINERVTIKRYYLTNKDTIALMPANEAYKPLIFHEGDGNVITVLGLVVGFTHIFTEITLIP